MSNLLTRDATLLINLVLNLDVDEACTHWAWRLKDDETLESQINFGRYLIVRGQSYANETAAAKRCM